MNRKRSNIPLLTLTLVVLLSTNYVVWSLFKRTGLPPSDWTLLLGIYLLGMFFVLVLVQTDAWYRNRRVYSANVWLHNHASGEDHRTFVSVHRSDADAAMVEFVQDYIQRVLGWSMRDVTYRIEPMHDQ